MQALKERTTIRTEWENVPATTQIFAGREKAYHGEVGAFTGGSTRLQFQGHTPELSSKAKEILSRIAAFKELSENWDGMGAVPPEGEVIAQAAYFLSRLDCYDMPLYFTAPGPNGEIVLEYREGKFSAEVYFEQDKPAEMLLYYEDEQIVSEVADMSKLIEHFSISQVY